MREQLLGYLLGALEPEEHEALATRLKREPDLRHELDLLRKSLQPLDADDEEPEPPRDLSAKTCEYVMARRGPCAGQFAAASSWRIQDIAVATGILIAAGLLFFPAVVNSRYVAQLTACQENLSTLGRALVQYSDLHADEFPVVPTKGNLAAAGIYAPMLINCGLIEPRHVICPASPLAAEKTFHVPSLAELQSAQATELRRLHRMMGGSYGYSLGYVENGRYHGHRNRSRSTFALMADMPDQHPAAGCRNDGAMGQNVLFEDGSVRFMRTVRLDEFGDHIYQNKLGYVGAGIGPDDAVISPSDMPPIVVKTSLDE
jgi:hypothetical protein